MPDAIIPDYSSFCDGCGAYTASGRVCQCPPVPCERCGWKACRCVPCGECADPTPEEALTEREEEIDRGRVGVVRVCPDCLEAA